VTLPLADIHAPVIDYKELSPLMATIGGSIVVLMVGLIRGRFVQTLLVPALTKVSLVTALGLTIWIWEPGVQKPILEGSLTVDTLALGVAVLVYVAGLVCVALSWRSVAPREAGHGEYHSMLLASITGMVLLAESSDLITVFVGIELLSIPLYVLCASELHRRTSLEAGLKYLVIGSVGSATLL
jgi:NADH-quinone oxidoreductase subunit N